MEDESASTLRTGSFGSYRILSALGSGGMGDVYLAEDSRLGRKVALKLLPPALADDPERMARFEREARAASALNHPNILTIYEVGSADGRQFFAAEFVDGENLRAYQFHTQLKLSEILDLAIQVASALSAAHQAGIVHRDIKPENIMLRHDGYAKVVDFGLAKLTQRTNASDDTSLSTILQVETGVGVVMGTTAYMSPEQSRGLELDARTDIWSLGVVLYEMVSGVMPFKGETPSDLIVSILERDPPPLSGTSIPSELEWIIRRALRKDRDERYQTARELLGDLRGLKKQLEFAAQAERSASLNPTTVSLAASGQGLTRNVSTAEPHLYPTIQMEQTPTATQTSAHQTSQWKLATAAAVALLIVGAIAAYKFWPSRKAATTPFQPMKITRLTNSGKAIDATLSPDGKYVVYALSDAGTQSLWIRQVSTANDTQIVPPARVGFFGLTFSKDGNDIYYVVKQPQVPGILYRVPTLGGTPKKVYERVDGPISFSPDGKQFVLLRGSFPNPGETALVIANTDGGDERILSVRKAPEYLLPIFYTGPSWSPDGKLIAAVVGRQQDYYVRTFAVADGKETELTPVPWGFAARVEWLPDMSGLLVIAGETVADSQVWFLSHPDGVKRKITNDLNGYRALGVAADGKRFSTIQQSGLVNIWVVPGADAKRAVQMGTGNVGWSGGSNLTWTADNRLVFVSNESGSPDIWVMDADGTNRKQLTANAGNNTGPVVTNDNRFILFSSERADGRNIWRMDLDGNNPRKLTNGIADLYPAVTPDGKWVFYTSISGGMPRIWKVSIDGGNATEFSNKVGLAPQVSPDGKSLAYMFPASGDSTAPPTRIGVMPIEGGDPIKVFVFEVGRTNSPHLVWSPDGRSIIYAVSDNVTNLWSQAIDGGEPKKITDFKDSLMTGFAWTRDGKILACTRGVLMRDAVLISEAE